MFFERQPLTGKHHSQTVMDPNGVMVKIYQLPGLFLRTNSNSLIGINLVQRGGHAAMLSRSWHFKNVNNSPLQRDTFGRIFTTMVLGK